MLHDYGVGREGICSEGRPQGPMVLRAAIGGHIARGLFNLQTDFPADVSPAQGGLETNLILTAAYR